MYIYIIGVKCTSILHMFYNCTHIITYYTLYTLPSNYAINKSLSTILHSNNWHTFILECYWDFMQVKNEYIPGMTHIEKSDDVSECQWNCMRRVTCVALSFHTNHSCSFLHDPHRLFDVRPKKNFTLYILKRRCPIKRETPRSVIYIHALTPKQNIRPHQQLTHARTQMRACTHM